MASASAKKIRPKYLSLPALLFEIRMPVPAWVSVTHRISGALLVFPFTAWLLFMLDASLASEQGYEKIRTEYLALLPVKLGLLLFIWAFCHHLCAGIRHLALDLHYGTDLPAARASSWAVLAVSIGLTLVIAVMLW